MSAFFGPEIGPVVNGKQSIKIMNKRGATETFISTKENVDRYMSESEQIGKKNGRKVTVATVIGAAVGAAAGHLSTKTAKFGKRSKFPRIVLGTGLVSFAASIISSVVAINSTAKQTEALQKELFQS